MAGDRGQRGEERTSREAVANKEKSGHGRRPNLSQNVFVSILVSILVSSTVPWCLLSVYYGSVYYRQARVELDTSAYVVSSTRGQVRWFLRPHQLQRVTAGQAGCEEKRGPGGSTQP